MRSRRAGATTRGEPPFLKKGGQKLLIVGVCEHCAKTLIVGVCEHCVKIFNRAIYDNKAKKFNAKQKIRAISLVFLCIIINQGSP